METTEQVTEDILDLARKLADARSRRDAIEADLDKVNKEIAGDDKTPGIEPRLAKLMIDSGLQLFSLEGHTFFTAVSSFPKILDEFGFFEFLAARGMDDIIKRSIHPQTLKAWFKEHPELEEDLKSPRRITADLTAIMGDVVVTDLPPLLSVYEKINVRVRRDAK